MSICTHHRAFEVYRLSKSLGAMGRIYNVNLYNQQTTIPTHLGDSYEMRRGSRTSAQNSFEPSLTFLSFSKQSL